MEPHRKSETERWPSDGHFDSQIYFEKKNLFLKVYSHKEPSGYQWLMRSLTTASIKFIQMRPFVDGDPPLLFSRRPTRDGNLVSYFELIFMAQSDGDRCTCWTDG